jgi:flagellar hook-associated protein 2
VQVNNLATAQMNAMNASVPPLTSASTIGQGTLRIDIGRWADDLSGFTPKDGSTTVDIVIGPGEDSLAQISAKINNTAGLGVRASVVNDAGGARLVLQSRSTGADNGFRVQVVDDDGVANDDAGLSRLAYDPQNGAAVSTRPQARPMPVPPSTVCRSSRPPTSSATSSTACR